MTAPIHILLQTTILTIEDDWHIGRFAMLRGMLAVLKGTDGTPITRVTARDRETASGPDPALSTLDTSDYDQLWLFAVDTGEGLDRADCAAISRFRAGQRADGDARPCRSEVVGLHAGWRRCHPLFPSAQSEA